MFYIMTMFFLGIFTVMDILKKQVWWPLSLIFMVVTVAVHFMAGDLAAPDITAGICFGLGLLIVSRLTREAIGYGDGLTVAACGAALGFWPVFGLFLLALFFSAVWSAVLLVTKKAGKKDSFPFIPFLLAAQVCVTAIR